MAATTRWVAGAQASYGALINSGDMTTLANGSTVLSTVATIANGTNLDQFMDISFVLAIASNTVVAGANFAFWIYNLNQDASHFGDNLLPTPGTPVAGTPFFSPCATVGILTGTQTTFYGTATGIVLPPGSFRVAVQNNSGFALTSGTQTVQYRTYNINLNV